MCRTGGTVLVSWCYLRRRFPVGRSFQPFSIRPRTPVFQIQSSFFLFLLLLLRHLLRHHLLLLSLLFHLGLCLLLLNCPFSFSFVLHQHWRHHQLGLRLTQVWMRLLPQVLRAMQSLALFRGLLQHAPSFQARRTLVEVGLLHSF